MTFWRSLWRLMRALRLAALVAVLVSPGLAVASGVDCVHQAAAKAPAVSTATAADCHETMPAFDQPRMTHDSADQTSGSDGGDDNALTCCGLGLSCATALALAPAIALHIHVPEKAAHSAAVIAAFSSRASLPDYPPPRA